MDYFPFANPETVYVEGKPRLVLGYFIHLEPTPPHTVTYLGVGGERFRWSQVHFRPTKDNPRLSTLRPADDYS